MIEPSRIVRKTGIPSSRPASVAGMSECLFWAWMTSARSRQRDLAFPAAEPRVEAERDAAEGVDHARPRRVVDDWHHRAGRLETARGELGEELGLRVLDLVIGIRERAESGGAQPATPLG